MRLEIFEPDFSNRHRVSHTIAVQLSEYYNDVGKISITVPADNYNAGIFKVNSIVYNVDRGTSYIIKNVEINSAENRITANGFSTNILINQRVDRYSMVVLTNVERDCYRIINDNLRGMSITTAPLKGLSATGCDSIYGQELLNGLMPILEKAGYGNRMNLDPTSFAYEFEIYQGENLTKETKGEKAVIFSDVRGSAQELIINTDNSLFKNVIYISGKFNDQYVTETVGDVDALPDNRYEGYIEASINPNDGETEQQFRNRLKELARDEIKKCAERQSFDVLINPEQLGVKYNLGDIVTCHSARFGIQFDKRIIGVKYTLDQNGSKTKCILGEPPIRPDINKLITRRMR